MGTTYGPRTFTPLSLSPALWLDASDSSTLYDSVTGGSLVAAGGSIARWEDKSGNGRHATQSTSGSRPTRQTGVQNGKDVIRFDGLDDFLTPLNSLSILRNKQEGSIFSVCKLSNGTNSDLTVLNISRNGNSTQLRLGLQLTTGSSGQQFRAGARRLDSDTFIGVTTSNNLNYNVLASISKYQIGQLFLRVNGVVNSTNLLSSGSTSDTDSDIVEIGKISTNYLNGDIAELIVFNSTLSDSNIKIVERYLAGKYGITIS